MTNADDMAHPVIQTDRYFDGEAGSYKDDTYSTGGLTKREYFAALAMQGLRAAQMEFGVEVMAELAVEHADALINALNNPNP